MRASLAFTMSVMVLAACTAKPGSAPPGATLPSEPALSYEAQQGLYVYRRYCKTCHGDTGAGDGFNAFTLDPHPRDLSDPAFQKEKTDQDLLDAVRRGGAGVGLSPLMPPWGHTLTPRQIEDVVLFIRSLRRKA